MSIMTSSLYDVSGWSDHIMRCTVGSPCETVANVFKKRAVPIVYVMYRLKFKTSFYTLFRILYSLLTVLSRTRLTHSRTSLLKNEGKYPMKHPLKSV